MPTQHQKVEIPLLRMYVFILLKLILTLNFTFWVKNKLRYTLILKFKCEQNKTGGFMSGKNQMMVMNLRCHRVKKVLGNKTGITIYS